MTQQPSRDDDDQAPTYCPTCGLRHDDPNDDNDTECAACARLRSLLVERFHRHRRKDDPPWVGG